MRLIAIDVLVVLAFVAIGRDTHNQGSAIIGFLQTAAPFLLAVPLGWLVAGETRLRPIRGGLSVAATTLIVGMIVRRYVFDDGTAGAFVAVAAGFFGVTMVMWRFWAQRAMAPA